MKSTAVSTLKATLSAHCLAKVKAGGEVIVMEQGKPICQVGTTASPWNIRCRTSSDLARADWLAGNGEVTVRVLEMRRPRDRRGQVVKALLSERAEGR